MFIFNPFDSDDGDIEVPELIEKTTQGRLVGEGAHQKGLAILLGEDDHITQPIGKVVIQSFFNPDAVSVGLIEV